MRIDGWNWTLPGIALAFGIGIGLLLVFTRGFWKALPGWAKWLVFVAIVAVLALFALGRLPLPF